jgi:hypothetical protein
MTYNKAIVGAVVSGLSAACGVAYQVDFTAFGNNDIRDLVIAFLIGAIAAGSSVWAVPNSKLRSKIGS